MQERGGRGEGMEGGYGRTRGWDEERDKEKDRTLTES